MYDYEQLGPNLYEVFNAVTGATLYLVNSEQSAKEEIEALNA
jgi:hypothetical protein